MSKTKVIAAYLKPDKTWEPQRVITLGPLEEEALLAHEAYCIKCNQEPKQLTTEEKLDTLLNSSKGADYILSQGDEYLANYTQWKLELDLLEQAMNEKYKKFYEELEKLPPGTKTC